MINHQKLSIFTLSNVLDFNLIMIINTFDYFRSLKVQDESLLVWILDNSYVG